MLKRWFGVLLAVLLFVSVGAPVFAAQTDEAEVLTISTADQLLVFAENCRLDAYSLGLTVVLAEDIDLSETEFSAVPYFAGTFEGNGHTISGLKLYGEGSEQGLFRYLAETAVVKDLHLQANISPVGSRADVGGIAGVNRGQIIDCSFDGNVSGGDGVGGIAGVNAVSGIIENCTVRGTMSGVHFVGGIAGINYGVVRSSVNRAEVNTTAQQNSVELSDVTVESITNSESSASATDIGGIAGTSTGVIRDCENYGSVGYRHMGYNVGGIAGAQAGYIADCVNHGVVSGRKEVGGIVGQMEPLSNIKYSADTLQILKGQLNTLSSMTNQAAGNAQNSSNAITEKIGELREQTDTAKSAVEVLLPGGGDDLDSILAAQNALSESVTSMPATMNEISAAAKNSMTILGQDLTAISEQVTIMGSTLNASNAIGTTFSDISDADTDRDQGGKVERCANSGSVMGDANVGGIAGAMAPENDLDLEDDWQVSGESSLNISTQLRAVVNACENRGTISCVKRNGGGIIGWQYMGLVKNSINLGTVSGAGADYMGGVVGRSSGYVRTNSAKCLVIGETFVGGIAGSGEIVSDCRSMVELQGGVERIGAVLGYAEESDNGTNGITDNYYLIVERDYGGIDGVSYADKAEPKGMEEFLALKELEEPFRTVTITFVFADGKTKQVLVPVGGALAAEDIPTIPEKPNCVSQWEGLADAELDEIMFDLRFEAKYISKHSVLETAETDADGMSVLMVQGVFSGDARVHIQDYDVKPKVRFGRTVLESIGVTVTEPEFLSAIRYRIPNHMTSELLRIYVCDCDGVWREAAYHIDGSYAVFDFTAGDTAFAVAEGTALKPILAVALLGMALLVWQYRGPVLKKRKK